MTNPNNAIGTNGAFGGRTSVNAFNDGLNAWSRGVMSGWACVPDSGMTVAIGGDPDTRDVAVAEDDAGNKTSINNISMAPVKVTIPGAPASNTRIDSIVAYVDNPPQGSADITDNYEACGIIVVSGTASSSPTAPNESTIRSAITADGATGATAYYVVLANVSVATGTTDITAGEILAGDVASLSAQGIIGTPNIADGSVTSEKIADGAATADKIDFTTFGEQFETEHTITGGKVRIARLGKIGFFSGTSDTVSYSGSFITKIVAIPGSLLPNGTIVLPVQATTVSHTVDDNQLTHGMPGSVISGSEGRSFTFPIMSTISTQKSCAVAFFFPVIFPD